MSSNISLRPRSSSVRSCERARRRHIFPTRTAGHQKARQASHVQPCGSDWSWLLRLLSFAFVRPHKGHLSVGFEESPPSLREPLDSGLVHLREHLVRPDALQVHEPLVDPAAVDDQRRRGFRDRAEPREPEGRQGVKESQEKQRRGACRALDSYGNMRALSSIRVSVRSADKAIHP